MVDYVYDIHKNRKQPSFYEENTPFLSNGIHLSTPEGNEALLKLIMRGIVNCILSPQQQQVPPQVPQQEHGAPVHNASEGHQNVSDWLRIWNNLPQPSLTEIRFLQMNSIKFPCLSNPSLTWSHYPHHPHVCLKCS